MMMHGSEPSDCQDLLIRIGGKVFLCLVGCGKTIVARESFDNPHV
jgi:hypothetical protein